MITPKEKAKDLVNKFWKWSMMDSNNSVSPYAKKCALIAVDEILNHHYQEQGLYKIDRYYWQEVKQEIEKL